MEICKPDQHDWAVVSTAIADVVLICECAICHAVGIVNDPSEQEWRDAFHAPSRPYKWHDNTRVVLLDLTQKGNFLA